MNNLISEMKTHLKEVSQEFKRLVREVFPIVYIRRARIEIADLQAQVVVLGDAIEKITNAESVSFCRVTARKALADADFLKNVTKAVTERRHRLADAKRMMKAQAQGA